MKEKIAIGCDHAGYRLKLELISMFKETGYDIVDFGCDSEDSIDYPDYAHPVADYVEKNNTLGVLICGSGNGISMAANKHRGVRAAICWSKEIAELARQHNNANILSLPARFISMDEAKAAARTFFATEFEGGRHERRVNKIACQ